MADSYNRVEEDTDFVGQVKDRVKAKIAEYLKIKHEQNRLEVQAERMKAYIEKLNGILEAEGQSSIPLKEISSGSSFGKPGNRAKNFPTRKVQWEGMSLKEIVESILNASPNETYHADVIAHEIYDIQSKQDVRMVKRSLVSTLRKGAKDGLWGFVPRNKYKANATKRMI